MGYLSEALINFLALLSNAARDGEEELMDLPAIVRRFEVEHVPIGGPIFDVAKLDWLNGRYVRERLDAASFVQRVARWAGSAERLERLAQLTAPRIERLSDIGPLLAFLFSGRLALSPQSFASSKLDVDSMRSIFSAALTEFDALPAWNASGIESVISALAAQLERKPREIARPLYIAVTGSPTSIPLYDSMELLGRDMVRERLRNALKVLEAA
jgi:glutamyl-tRNA synthetase